MAVVSWGRGLKAVTLGTWFPELQPLLFVLGEVGAQGRDSRQRGLGPS